MIHTTLLPPPPINPSPFCSWNITDNVTSQSVAVAVFWPWDSFPANIFMALYLGAYNKSSQYYLKLQPIPLILDFFTMMLFIALKCHDIYLHIMFICMLSH